MLCKYFFSILLIFGSLFLHAQENASTSDLDDNNFGALFISPAPPSPRAPYVYFVFQTPMPEGETIKVTIQSSSIAPLNVDLRSTQGEIRWKSPPLPPGAYKLIYTLPSSYKPAEPEILILKPGETLVFTPTLQSIDKKTSLHLISNIPEAIFILRSTKSSQVWKGTGREYTFSDLPAGIYLLSLTSTEPDYFIPPAQMRFNLNDQENKEIKSFFQMAGKLTIKTNVEHSKITIQEIGGKRQSTEDQFFEKTKTFTLPEGKYRITLDLPSSSNESISKMTPPPPVDVTIRALKNEELNLPYKIDNGTTSVPTPENSGKITISINISMGGFTLKKYTDSNEEFVAHYTGRSIRLPLPPADRYAIVFDAVPGYQAPEEIDFDAIPTQAISAIYKPFIQTLPVAAGKSIVGDASSEENINERNAKVVNIRAFNIGTYEITNAQYAAWLTEAYKLGKITYIKEADNQGQVLDNQGRLLFKTFTADPYSQIAFQQQSADGALFLSLPGKDLYPIINVSWYGAMAFCQDNNCRLPSEAEWEKAAAMQPPISGEPLAKYIFGFSSNTIDPSWANYRSTDQAILHFRVLTTPVGFYNGTNVLPLTSNNIKQQMTHLAKSPYGAFDMSGNVWEWVADWFDDSYTKNIADIDPQGPNSGILKVVKGGCYDSLADGVRVSERLGLLPSHCDAYTGFRVASD